MMRGAVEVGGELPARGQQPIAVVLPVERARRDRARDGVGRLAAEARLVQPEVLVVFETLAHQLPADALDRDRRPAADAIGRAGVEEGAVAVAAEEPLVLPGIEPAPKGLDGVVVELAADA